MWNKATPKNAAAESREAKRAGGTSPTARLWKRAAALLAILLATLLPLQPAGAQQQLMAVGPSAQPYPVIFNDSITDLSVKVWGGSIDIRRGYIEGVWYSNINWMPIKFTYDSLDNSILTITRGHTDYTRAAPGVYQDSHSNTLRQTSTGFHWNNPQGDWIDYNPAGEIKAFGDRNGTIASFLYSGTASIILGGATITATPLSSTGATGPTIAPSEGRITGILDHNSTQVLWFDYDAHNALIAIRDNAGRKVQYQWSAATSGQTLAVLDPNGNTWTYTLSNIVPTTPGGFTFVAIASDAGAGGAIIAATQPAPPPATECPIPNAGSTLQVTDPEGHTITRRYYSNGQLALTNYPDGSAVCMYQDYDSAKQVFYTRETGPYLSNGTGAIPPGAKMVETWSGLTQDKSRGEIQRRDINGVTVEKQSLDTASRTTTVTDARGLNTAITRDQWYNVTKVVHPDGSIVSAQYDSTYSNVTQHVDENGVITQNTYDAHGNLLKTIEAFGLPEQRTTLYTYDTSGQRISMTQKGDANTADATTQYAYDAYGNVAQVTDAEGGITSYTYDVMGNAITITDPLGKVWKRTFDNRGNLTGAADPLNRTVSITYDKTGLPVNFTDAANNTSMLAFDPKGKLLAIIDSYGAKTSYTYDAAGKPITLTDAANHTQRLDYDADGRPVKYTDGNGNVSQFAFGDATSGLNRLLTKIIYPNLSLEFRYDNRNRITQGNIAATGASLALDGSATQTAKFQYDVTGDLTSFIDAASRSAGVRYNGFRQIIQDTDPSGGITQYSYDARGNRISVKDPKGNTYFFAYDRLNRTVMEIRPLGQAITYAYDANGNLVQITDPKGQIRKYTYDAVNRRVREGRYLTATDTVSAKTITYTWNAFNRLTGYNDGTTQATYTYDAQQRRRTGESINYGTFSLSSSTAYNALGQKSSITYPDGVQYTYTYDGNNQLSTVTLPTGSITINSYNWTVPSQITLPGGTVRSLTYDGLLRPKSIDVKDPGQSQVMSYQYTYDLTSNIIAKATEQGTSSYTYDTLDHLTGVTYTNTAQASEAYTYDPVANRLTSAKTSAAWVYDANNQLTSADNLSYTYDANGNTLTVTDSLNAANSRSYVYDTDNRLTEVHDASNALIASYTYDPFGRRLSKTAVSNGVSATQYYFYNSQGLIAEADASGAITRTYGYAPGSSFSTNPLFTKVGIQYYYYQNDHLGTPMKLVNQSGTVVWSATYDAFGNATVDPASTVTNNLRFPGQYYDAETGLHYNWNRYYDPNTGRYSTSDPIGLAGGVNMYTYVGGKPFRFLDPLGLYSVDEFLGDAANAVVGFGDGVSSILTLGMYSTADFRRNHGIEGNVDPCSTAYKAGKYAGYVWGVGTLWAAGLNGGANSVFWSGYSQGARGIAEGLGTTLEQTPIGGAMDYLANTLGVNLPNSLWQAASATFAANAEGTATAVILSTNPASVWATIEAPILAWRGITVIFF